MTRMKKLAFGMMTSAVYQIVTIVCNMILPRVIIGHFGSATNGLVNSITQFLGFISLCELGMGAVVQSALYKPLAEQDASQISRIFISSERFFRKIGYILMAYVGVLLVIFPSISHSRFDAVYVCVLILIISISTFAQYFIGITYQILLNADQKAYISVLAQTVVLIINTVISCWLIYSNCSIHFVKLAASLIFLVRPVILIVYVRRQFVIDKKVPLDGEPIAQKWNGIAQHFAQVALVNTPTVVLTLFSTLENVSIYSVYYLVANGVRQLFISLTNGVQALLGNMYVRNEAGLCRKFDVIETMIHGSVTLIFTITGLMIVPFIQVYTAEITDAQYVQVPVAVCITLSYGVYCIRLPYQMMIFAAGHYKQTQNGSFIEAGVNVIVSVVLVFRFGIVGVCLGMMAAVVYRLTYYAFYLSKHIICYPISRYFMKCLTDLTAAGVMLLTCGMIHLSCGSFLQWIIKAAMVSAICCVECAAIYFVIYRKDVSEVLRVLRGIKLRKC
ncbi:MAG: hypothetical protein H6Q60_1347 [Oscillospiraceae bacterium]|nr:hypothetical protein [Oscillospiraceae bacterium]